MATGTPPLGRPSSRLSLCLSWQPGVADGAVTVLDTGAAATDLVRLLFSPSSHAQETMALRELNCGRSYHVSESLHC